VQRPFLLLNGGLRSVDPSFPIRLSFGNHHPFSISRGELDHSARITGSLGCIIALAIGSAGCNDPIEPVQPAIAVALIDSAQAAPPGGVVPAVPSVRVTTASDRPVPGVRVLFAVASGGGSLTGAEQITDASGVARVGSWTLGTTPGANSMRATIEGLPGVELFFEAVALPADCSGLVSLDMTLGQFIRLKGSTTARYPCLHFDAHQSAGSEYLLLFENMAPTGGFSTALFPGPAGDTALAFTLDLAPLTSAAASRAIREVRLARLQAEDATEAHAWDFGAGRIHEHTPPQRASVSAPVLLRDGMAFDVNSLAVTPIPGDTIQILLEGIPRLSINTGNQRAVVRFVSDDLIIAEDVRLATLVRENGGVNTPLTQNDLIEIAAQYNATARVQGNLLFDGRYNSAVEATTPHRVTAVHSLMPADNVWGYTYSVSNYFVWDYWVGTDGATKGLNQHPQRVADNLFMHESAHMRHFGLLQRHGLEGSRGNNWLVEGFARFIERMPIAARLLGTVAPSRTGNVVLPRNPAFNNAYFVDDVPTYLNAGSSMFFGYQTSSFVFDYFADQVSLRGGDWLVATREFLLAGRSRAALDEVVHAWLPGTSFTDLFTQARIALYTDDIGTTGLPAWTQYHQFRLRESRPAPTQAAAQDPRVQWVRISTAAPITISGQVASGSASGFIIDGTTAPTGLIRVSAPQGPHALLAIARIR
jgi:hypothetical protein